VKKNIGTLTVGELIAELQEYDPTLPIGVLTFDQDDQGDGPYFAIRAEMYVYMHGHARYLGITGYGYKDEVEGA
jgi:hypothetical protein